MTPLQLATQRRRTSIKSQRVIFCQQEKLSFPRSRPYRKNDNCFVEQKNYPVVRRAVGYHRYDTEAQLQLLNELYAHLRLYTNFFQPTMKFKTPFPHIGTRAAHGNEASSAPIARKC